MEKKIYEENIKMTTQDLDLDIPGTDKRNAKKLMEDEKHPRIPKGRKNVEEKEE